LEVKANPGVATLPLKKERHQGQVGLTTLQVFPE
jgi:hypothetical protein